MICNDCHTKINEIQEFIQMAREKSPQVKERLDQMHFGSSIIVCRNCQKSSCGCEDLGGVTEAASADQNVTNDEHLEGVNTIASPTATFITTQGTSTPQVSQLSTNKKITIISQEILVPANNMKQYY